MNVWTVWAIASWTKFFFDNTALLFVLLPTLTVVIVRLRSVCCQRKSPKTMSTASGLATVHLRHGDNRVLLERHASGAKITELRHELWYAIVRFVALVFCGLFVLWLMSHSWSVYRVHLTLRERQFQVAKVELLEMCAYPSEVRAKHCNAMRRITAQSPESWALGETAAHMIGDMNPLAGYCPLGSYCNTVLLSSIEALLGSVIWLTLLAIVVVLTYAYVLYRGPVKIVNEIGRFEREAQTRDTQQISRAASSASPAQLVHRACVRPRYPVPRTQTREGFDGDAVLVNTE